MVSVIIPVYNERPNIGPLYEDLAAVLGQLPHPYEILFIDDGSTDGSSDELEKLAASDPHVKVVFFRRNFGQTAAMMAGIERASGDVIIPMDGDGQNDPADIPRLLATLEEGYDVVSGWRRDRQDKPFTRVFLSRIANWLISWISGVHLRDYGCTLKAYRRDSVKPLRLYGEMHRFIPIYASWEGARVTEIPVNHRPRLRGQSKYGLERVMKVILDLIVVQFLGRYETKPIYVFGSLGLLSFFVAFLAGSYAVYLKITTGASFILTPLPLLSVMAAITGAMTILLGLIAELLVRTYYESQNKSPYAIKRTLNLRDS